MTRTRGRAAAALLAVAVLLATGAGWAACEPAPARPAEVGADGP